MKIVVDHMLNVGKNLEKQINYLSYKIDELNNIIRLYENYDQIRDYVYNIRKCMEVLIDEREHMIQFAEVVYISINYYLKWDKETASNIYDDKILYPVKQKGVVDLSGIEEYLK